jgi:hypothetical protein
MSNTFSTPSVVTTISQSRLDYNEALLSLLQNFASSGQPSGAEINSDGTTGLRTGMLWYKSGADTADGQGRMLVYNGAEFTRNGLAVYKMPSVVAANAAAVATKISYGELVSVGSDALYMVNAANNGVFQVGGDAVTLSGLTSGQFVRTDTSSTITGNVTFSGTGFVKLPLGNDSQRPGTPTAGMLRFSNTTGSFEGYDGVEWGEIGGGGAFTDDGTYVFYTGSANVGIGVAAPQANLHIKGTGNVLRLETGTLTDANGVAIRFQQSDTTIINGQGYGGIEWSGADSGNDGIRGYIKGVSEGDSGQIAVRIGTQATGVSAPTDRVTIDSAGRVGIGTVSPNVTLQVAGNVHLSGGDATIFNRSSNYLALGANNIEALRILPNTNIGIGVTAPTANLHIAGTGPVLKLQTATATDSTGVSLQLIQTDTTIISGQGYGGVEWFGLDASGTGVRGYVKGFAEGDSGEFGIRIATQATGISSPVDRVYVSNTGRVGIGVAAPTSTLDVNGAVTALLYSGDGGGLSNLVNAYANDGVTLATARGNDHSTLLSARSNDYATYLTLSANDGVTLATARGNDHATLLSAYANDYATYLTLSANDGVTLATARGNDHATLLSAQANDGATLLTARSNDYATLLAAYSNDFATFNSAKANDWATYSTLSANDGATLLTARSNDYATLLAAQSNDGATLLTARSNDWATYTTLAANDYNTLLSAYSNDAVTLLNARANDLATFNSASANDFNSYTTIINTINDLDARFLRSNAAAIKATGDLKLNDSIQLNLGTDNDVEHYFNGIDYYTDINIGANWFLRDGDSANATRFTFDIDTGNFTATGDVAAFSDARLKSNIHTYENALATVQQLRGVRYERNNKLNIGVIAQEVQAILPEVVNTDNEYLAVSYGNIIAVLIEAIKELNLKIEKLEKGK